MVEKFQEVAEKTEEREKTSGHDKLSKNLMEDTKPKLTELQDKVIDCNQELEKKLQWIFPNYDVSYY